MEQLKNSQLYRHPSEEMLDHLRRKNINQKITFLLPTKYISREASAVATLLDHIYNQSREKKTIFRSFFASCHWEAVSGIVKLIRHNFYVVNALSLSKVLILDPRDQLKLFFQQGLVSSPPLIPSIEIVHSIKEAKKLLEDAKDIHGFICGIYSEMDLQAVDELFRECKKRGVISVLDESSLENWFQNKGNYIFKFPPDAYIAGESLANYQIPFSSFSVTAKTYEPWNNLAECLAHSSTYSGNTISLSIVYSNMKKQGFSGPEMPIFKSRRSKYKYYARHVNPFISWIFYSTHLSPEVIRAYKSRLFISNWKNQAEEVIDGIAGSGCCLRGHNPADLISNVLEKHLKEKDYWIALKQKLVSLSGFKHIFPAVSGSTSVDIAIILGLLAQQQKGRIKILTFHDNYSGKSLISLNLSRYEHFQKPFVPLYQEIIEIDPFALNATDQLEKTLLSGEIAIVWFEMIQGQNLDFLPDPIIDCINRNKKKGGYLVGIDEILTGMYRTGSFLCSNNKVHDPDLIVISKATSDMSFPSAYVLVSELTFQNAYKRNSRLVNEFETKFINQLGAHITLNALEQIEKIDIKNQVNMRFKFFYESLKESIDNSKLHHRIVGKGLLIYIKLNKARFPINIIGEHFAEFLMSKYFLRIGKVLFLNSRITPSILIEPEDMNELVYRIKKTIPQIKSFPLFCLFLKQISRIYTLIFIQRLNEAYFREKQRVSRILKIVINKILKFATSA